MINNIAWQGKFVISIKDKNTGRVTEEIINNRVMNAVLNDFADSLTGSAVDLQIKYLALGTGNTAITDSDLVLDTEIFRTAPTSGPTLTGTGEVTTEFYVLDSEAIGQIEEIGIFAGSTATVSADSGILLSRILWSRNKTSSEEITFKRIDRIIRG